MEENKLKKQLIEEHLYLNSPESKEFTQKFMTELGKEMDEMFKGVTFVMSLRYKSYKSANGKIDRIITRTDPLAKNIYDNIGLKIVVTHVSDKVEHVNCQHIIEKREKWNNERQEKTAHKDNVVLQLKDLMTCRANNLLEEVKCIDEGYYENFKFMFNIANTAKEKDIINELRRVTAELENFVEKNKNKIVMNSQESEIKQLKEQLSQNETKSKLELIKEINENIQKTTQLYNEEDRKCNDLYSTYMLEQIRNNSKVLKGLGITAIPGRYKRHTGSKHYYVASHNSFKTGKKSEIHDWKIEMQVTSDYYNQDATEGKAKHSEKEGKARNLPNLPKSKFEYESNIKDGVPETFVYVSGTGETRKCSDFESFYLYYKEVINGSQYLDNLDNVLNSEVEEEEQEK